MTRKYTYRVRTAGRTEGAKKDCDKKRYNSRSPEEIEKNRRRARAFHLSRYYGMTIDEYDALYAAQGGVCALCNNPNRKTNGSLGVDHCHKTGRIRGLLCTGCNLAIATLGDDEDGLQKALDYIRKK